MLNLLKSHISKDPRRVQLTGAFFDKTYGKAVACDGHRMVMIEAQSPEIAALFNQYADRVFDFKANLPLAVEYKYPNWKQLNPDLKDYKALPMTFPTWFKNIKAKRKGIDIIHLTLEGFQLFKNDKVLISFNLAYMAPYAGLEVICHYKDSLSSMVIKPQSGEQWSAVLMPLRP